MLSAMAEQLGIDIDAETLLTVAEASAHACLRNPNGRPCAVAKIYRLFDAGIRGIRLEWISVPGGRRTSKEAIARFIQQLNEADHNRSPVTTTAKRRAMQAVDHELDELGIC